MPKIAVASGSIKEMRERAGLTQAELARRIGTSQSRLSTYERGTVPPSQRTLARVSDATRELPSVLLDRCRNQVIAQAAAHGLSNVRVFGSVARGDDHLDSDIDLLVATSPDTSLVDLSASATTSRV